MRGEHAKRAHGTNKISICRKRSRTFIAQQKQPMEAREFTPNYAAIMFAFLGSASFG